MSIKPGSFIPNNERWLYTEKHAKQIDKAIEWVEANPRRDNFDEIVGAIKHE